ncbi:MAG: hypothetical protein RL417_2458, partial [Pseudomonadota bacterium]
SFRDSIARIEGYKTRIATVQSSLAFQDDLLKQVDELVTRARELATQAANEPNSSTTRASMANEVFALRDQLVVLANTRDSTGYIFGGADNDDPPYDRVADYASPASGLAAVRYRFDAEAGTQQQRSTAVTDDISITVNTPGDQLFDNALYALERLGRAMSGYQTTVDGSGVPDGTGAAYNFPTDFTQQTRDIQSALDDLIGASRDDLLPERVSLGARLSRLEAAQSIIEVNKANAEEVLGKLQNADSVEAISNLTLAQNALEASLQVTVRVLKQSILDFL